MSTIQRLRTAIAGLGVITIIMTGCGSSGPSASASVTAPSLAASPSAPVASQGSAAPAASLPTTGRIAVVEKGYAITLPQAWTRIDLGPNGMKDILNAGASALPQDMQDMLGGQVGQLAASGVLVFAFRRPDAAIAGGTTLNILSLPSLGIPLDTFESLIVTQLKSVVGQDTQIATSRVQGPAGEFLRLSYDLKANGQSIGTVQYIFAGPTQQYVISCGTPGPISAIQTECEAIALTLELLS